MMHWLKDTVKLPKYYGLLIDQGFDDLESVEDLTMDDLKQIGIDKLGHQKRIIKYAQQLNGSPQDLHRNKRKRRYEDINDDGEGTVYISNIPNKKIKERYCK